jgi:hypothetical protein
MSRRIAVLGTLLLVLLVAWHRHAPNRWLFLVISAGTAILAIAGYCLSRAEGRDRRHGQVVLVVALAAAGWIWRPILFETLTTPREWDFLAFYFYGKVAAAGLPLYEPASFHSIAQGLGVSVSQGFAVEVLDVGFIYPPPTVFLFVPLAALDLASANLAWHGFVALSLLGAGCVAGFLLGRPWRWEAAALGTSLTLCLPPTLVNQDNGQTSGLLTIVSCLTILTISRAAGGAWAGLGVVIKPLFAIPAAAIVAVRNWRGVAAGIAVGAVALLLSGAVLGFDQIQEYLRQDYLERLPDILYRHPTNQSLLATLMRLTDSTGMPETNPGVFATWLILVVVILGVTGLVAWRAGRTDRGAAYCVFLPAAMMVYPSTMLSYGTLFVVPLVLEAARAASDPRERRVVFALCGILIPVSGVSIFGAALLLWAFLVWRCWQAGERPSRRSPILAG